MCLKSQGQEKIRRQGDSVYNALIVLQMEIQAGPMTLLVTLTKLNNSLIVSNREN